jgi:hypothetical protein
MSIKRSLFILWRAVEDGIYNPRSIAGDEALNLRETIFKDTKQFWIEYNQFLDKHPNGRQDG